MMRRILSVCSVVKKSTAARRFNSQHIPLILNVSLKASEIL